MQQSQSRNGPPYYDEPTRNTCRNFRSTSKWMKDSISNDVTAYTLNLPNESRLSSLKKHRNQRITSYNKQDGYMQESSDDKFSPKQNIQELLQNFEGPFWKILDCCANKYVQLVKQCESEYNYLKQILIHYPQSKHLPSYFNQMHVNSTDTKINLLKMLTEVQNKLKRKQSKLKDQKQENQQLKLEVLKLKKLSKSKDQAYLGQVQDSKELQQKIVQLEGRIKGLQNECQQLQQRQSHYKQDLRDKEVKMKKMEGDKQNMKRQVQQIERRMQGLKLHDKQNQEKPKIKQKIRNMAGKKVPEVDEICEDEAKSKFERANNQTDEDLYRCLFIQACTIEVDLLEQ